MPSLDIFVRYVVSKKGLKDSPGDCPQEFPLNTLRSQCTKVGAFLQQVLLRTLSTS